MCSYFHTFENTKMHFFFCNIYTFLLIKPELLPRHTWTFTHPIIQIHIILKNFLVLHKRRRYYHKYHVVYISTDTPKTNVLNIYYSFLLIYILSLFALQVTINSVRKQNTVNLHNRRFYMFRSCNILRREREHSYVKCGTLCKWFVVSLLLMTIRYCQLFVKKSMQASYVIWTLTCLY